MSTIFIRSVDQGTRCEIHVGEVCQRMGRRWGHPTRPWDPTSHR